MAEQTSKEFFAPAHAQSPTGAAHGEITGGVLKDGPRIPGHSAVMPWKCVACGVDQVSNPDDGCPSCGSGTAKPYVKVDPPPPTPPLEQVRPHSAVKAETGGADAPPLPDFEAWWATINASLLTPYGLARLAWTAGYQEHERRTMTAAPVTADTAALAPEGRTRRTLIAALEYFLTVVETNPEEVASGEWLTLAEVKTLIRQLQQEETDAGE